MNLINMPNGKMIYVDETKPEQFKQFIEEQCGSEAAIFVQDLIDKADYTTRKLDTDLNSYEGSLEEWNTVGNDILETTEKINTYLKKSKRIDRDTIFKMINEIKRTINEVM